jgi:tetratricopeptide (TPR) repeat protein
MFKSRVFVSYSHSGEGPWWKAELLRALNVFEQHHLIDVWQDGIIRVGAHWDDDIKEAMARAKIAVLLLTREALQSDYILNVEFPTLRERQRGDGLIVIPIICEDCDWLSHDWLCANQAPNESKPLSGLCDFERDRVFRKVAADIAEEFSRIALADIAQSDRKLSVDRIYLDKLPPFGSSGLKAEQLIGREQELALLDLAYAQTGTAIASIVAWGGVGKTMLIKHWLRKLESRGWSGAQRVYAWNFYSQGTNEDRQVSEDNFFAHALRWFGVQCEPTLGLEDKASLLAQAVARQRTLLILDGIEPLQYPPGPMAGRLRAYGIRSLLRRLIQKANDGEYQGLCLNTTREPLTDFTNFQRRPNAAWGRVLCLGLSNLTEEAGAALLYHSGAKRAGSAEIKGDDLELRQASRSVDGHALSLTLLGRFLSRAHSGDVRRRDLVGFEQADREIQGGTTFRMLAGFENWFAKGGELGARQLAVLRMVGLFDRPADAGCVNVLRAPPIIEGLTDPLFIIRWDTDAARPTVRPIIDEDWNATLSFLADLNLIEALAETKLSSSLSIDCHPLIREYFSRKLKSQDRPWRLAHQRLYEYLCRAAPECTQLGFWEIFQQERRTKGPYDPQHTVEDIEPLYHAVVHGCQAGLSIFAFFNVYRDRILRRTAQYSKYKLGSFSSDLAAAACFFERPWSRPLPLFSDAAQGYLLNDVAFSLRSLGRLTEAIEPAYAATKLATSLGDWRNAAIGAKNCSELELALGKVADAMVSAEQCRDYADRSGYVEEQIDARSAYADALCQEGQHVAAGKWFREAEEIQSEIEHRSPLLYSIRGFSYCELLLSLSERCAWRCMLGLRVSDTLSLSESCHNVARRAQQSIEWVERDAQELLGVALGHLAHGRAMFYQAILRKLDVQNLNFGIDQAMNGIRQTGQQQFMPFGLLTRAWLLCLENNIDDARASLDEAWEIAERGALLLHVADICLYRARLFFRSKCYPWKSPHDDLATAERLISGCGYHRRDVELNDAKIIILGLATTT